MSGLPRVKTFGVNSTNDMYLDEFGNIAIVVDLQAVLQACQQAAKTLAGEMILQTNQGLPYFTAVWVGVPNLPAFEGALRTAWLAVEGVTAINRLVTNQSLMTIPGTAVTAWTLSYSAIIDTIYGTGNIVTEDVFNG